MKLVRVSLEINRLAKKESFSSIDFLTFSKLISENFVLSSVNRDQYPRKPAFLLISQFGPHRVTYVEILKM